MTLSRAALLMTTHSLAMVTVSGLMLGLFDSIGVIEPKGDISIPAGAALELNCTMTEYNTTLDSQWLYFNHKPDDQVQHVRVPREYTRILGPRKIGLVIPGVELKHSGWYFCLLNESSIGKAEDTSITQKSVIVSEPPRVITSIKAVSNNFEDMVIDWCDQAEDRVRYDLYWRIGENVRQGVCQNYTSTRDLVARCRCHFYMNERDGKVQDFFQLSTYKIYINSTKAHYVLMSDGIEVRTSFDIVKPSPPSELYVNSVNGTTISVEWAAPLGLEWKPLDYIISYTSHRDVSPVDVVVNGLSVMLTDLHPYTHYNVSIMATPTGGKGYRSDMRWKSTQTNQTACSAGPRFLAGSFRVLSTQSSYRRVIVLWGTIDSDDVNGVLSNYTVRQKLLGGDDGEIRELNTTSNHHSIELSLHNDKAYSVAVAGHTIADGVYSTIHIPKTQQVLIPRHVEAEVSLNELSVNIMVVPPEGISVDNYTLLYCIGGMKNGLWDIEKCKDSSAAMTLTYPGNSTTFTFYGHNSGYVYAVAMNYREGTSGLSPTWLCLYDFDGDPGQPRIKFPIGQQERSLTIEWEHLQCDVTVRGSVIMYSIEIYRGLEHVMNVSVLAVYSDTLKSYTVRELEPYTVYEVRLAACTKIRCWETRNDSHRTPQSAPGTPPVDVHSGHIPGSNIVTIQWQPPLVPNGIISRYNITVKKAGSSSVVYSVVVDSSNKTSCVIEDLPGYANYTVEVEAINSAGASPTSQPEYVFMSIRAPTAILFSYEIIDASTIDVKWPTPESRNGPDPKYVLTTSMGQSERNYSVDGHLRRVKIDCSTDHVQTMNISMVAYNELDGHKLLGPKHRAEIKNLCGKTIVDNQINLKISISVVIVVVLVVAILVIFLCCCRRNDDDIERDQVIFPDIEEKYLKEPMIPPEVTGSSDYTSIPGDSSQGETVVPRLDSETDSGISDSSPPASLDTTHSVLSSQVQDESRPPVHSQRSRTSMSEYAKATDNVMPVLLQPHPSGSAELVEEEEDPEEAPEVPPRGDFVINMSIMEILQRGQDGDGLSPLMLVLEDIVDDTDDLSDNQMRHSYSTMAQQNSESDEECTDVDNPKISDNCRNENLNTGYMPGNYTRKPLFDKPTTEPVSHIARNKENTVIDTVAGTPSDKPCPFVKNSLPENSDATQTVMPLILTEPISVEDSSDEDNNTDSEESTASGPITPANTESSYQGAPNGGTNYLPVHGIGMERPIEFHKPVTPNVSHFPESNTRDDSDEHITNC